MICFFFIILFHFINQKLQMVPFLIRYNIEQFAIWIYNFIHIYRAFPKEIRTLV